MRLAGKVALISGGAEGIGAATARRFVAEGARVVLGDVQIEKARALAEEIGGDAVELDVRSEAQWQAAVAHTVARFGKLTTLCNIAGISEPDGVTEASLDSWQRTLDINLTGTILGCRTAIPAMVASGEPCAIVNTGSMLALRPGGMFPAYVASKAGVAALTRAVAHTRFRGEATGFVDQHWPETVVPVLYYRDLGAGGVLYNTLGHCRGHWDLPELMPFWDHPERCAWNYPVYFELLRRGLRWAMGA